MPFSPQPKVPGDLIKSTDWNEAMTEVVRLEGAKLNITGGNISGPLAIGSGIGGGGQIPALRVNHNGAFAWGNALSIDQPVAGNNDGPKIRFQKTMAGVPAAKSWSAGIVNGPTQGHFVIHEDTGAGFGTNRLTIAPGGNVGIGTANPLELLQLGDRWTFHNGGAKVIGLNSTWNGASDVRILNGGAAQLRFNNDGSLIIRNIPNGNAGTPATGSDITFVDGNIRFDSSTARRIGGDLRGGQNAVVVGGNWDELEIKGRVLDWTGSNLHIGYQNDHSNDGVYFGNGKLGKVEISNPATLDFGASVRQMINLWSTSYGIGVQSGTTYFRSGGNFAWFAGGVHNDNTNIPGAGGIKLMSLNGAGDLCLSARSNPNGNGPNGCRALVDGNNKLCINYANDFALGTEIQSNLIVTGAAFKPGGGAWALWSDKKLKKNIKQLKGSLQKLLKLRGVNFDWKNPELQGGASATQTGLIAQEVEEVFPEWVGEHADGTKYIAITGFEAHVIESIKTVYDEVQAIKAQLSKK